MMYPFELDVFICITISLLVVTAYGSLMHPSSLVDFVES